MERTSQIINLIITETKQPESDITPDDIMLGILKD
jgi:hypothetical protein